MNSQWIYLPALLLIVPSLAVRIHGDTWSLDGISDIWSPTDITIDAGFVVWTIVIVLSIYKAYREPCCDQIENAGSSSSGHEPSTVAPQVNGQDPVERPTMQGGTIAQPGADPGNVSGNPPIADLSPTGSDESFFNPQVGSDEWYFGLQTWTDIVERLRSDKATLQQQLTDLVRNGTDASLVQLNEDMVQQLAERERELDEKNLDHDHCRRKLESAEKMLSGSQNKLKGMIQDSDKKDIVMQSLRQSLEEHQAEIRRLGEEASDTSWRHGEELSQQRLKMAAESQDEMLHLRALNEENRNKSEILQTQIQTQRHSLEKQIEKLTGEKDTLAAEVDSLQKQARTHAEEKRNRAMESWTVPKKTDNASTPNSTGPQVVDFRRGDQDLHFDAAEIERLITAYETVESQNTGLREQTQALMSHNETLKSTIEQREQNIQALMSDNESLKSNIKLGEQNIEGMKSENEVLESKIQQGDQNLAALMSVNESLRNDMEGMSRPSDEPSCNIVAHQSLEPDHVELHKQFESIREELDGLNHQLAGEMTTIRNLTAELANAEEKCKGKEKEITDLREEKKKAEKKNTSSKVADNLVVELLKLVHAALQKAKVEDLVAINFVVNTGDATSRKRYLDGMLGQLIEAYHQLIEDNKTTNNRYVQMNRTYQEIRKRVTRLEGELEVARRSSGQKGTRS